MVVLYIFLIISISLGVLTRITFFSFVNIYLFDLFAILIIILSAKNIFLFLKKNFRQAIPLFLFFVISSIGLFFNTKNILEFISSIAYLIRVICYLFVFIPLLGIKKERLHTLKKIMLFAGLFFILLGYVQYLFYPNLRNLYYLGWDEHLYRLFSTFLDPNFAGAFIVLIILLYSYYFFELFKKASSIMKSLLILGYLFIIPSIFLTYSRSALVMLFVSLIIFLILIKKKAILLFFLLLFFLGIILLPKNLGGEGVKLLRTASIFARLHSYREATVIFTKNPLAGVGFDSLRFVYQRYGFVSQEQAIISHSAAGVPNSFLFILATTGITGFSLFCYLLYLLSKKIWHKRKGMVMYSGYVLAAFLGVLVDGLFENSLFYAQILLWLVLSAGILFGLSKNKSKES